MEAPVCLIENLPGGRLQVNSEAVDILSKINQPLVVVATVGMYRTGKSYMMNRLAGFQKGFELGATVQAKTKGIWMWCVPHPTMKDHTLVLLDTEGLGDIQKGDKKNDLKIFCLSVLLSSVLIYNSRGTIDEDAIEKLRFVGELADLIKVKSKDNEDDEGQFSRHFPAFIWMVRDFILTPEYDGEEITVDEYLEKSLKPQQLENSEETSRIEERNRCRDAIRMYFSTRKCFAFDLPSGDKKVLQRMDEVPEEEISASFRAQCQTFCEYIYTNAEVKHIDDIKPVSGEILGQLVYKYTEAITSTSVVCMEDAVKSISETENEAAVQVATEHYEKMMRERVHFPTETLQEFTDLSAQCEEEALQKFLEKSFRDSELRFHEEFMGKIEEKKKGFSRLNETASLNYCKRLIKKFSRDLNEALKHKLYSKPGGYQKFLEDMEMVEERYNREPRKGVQAQHILQRFISSKEADGASIKSDVQALSEQQENMEEGSLMIQRTRADSRLQELESSNQSVIEESKKRTFGEHLRQLLKRKKTDNIQRQERLERVIQSKYRERDFYMAGGFACYARTYDHQIGNLSSECQALKDPEVLKCVATFFQKYGLLILGIAALLAVALVKIIVFKSL